MTFYQPHQEASQEFQRQSTVPSRSLKTAANIGLGVATGSTILNRALPFFSKFIPQNIALKGLSRVNPTMGKFISASEEQGFDPQEIYDFMENKLKEGIGQQEETEAKDERNLIQKYSPEIFQTLEYLIKQGLSPAQAALDIRQHEDSKVKNLISQMEKDYKQDWPSIVESVFGQAGVQKPAQQQKQGGMSDQDLIAKLQQALSL